MSTIHNYKAPNPSRIEKFLWRCCGADEQIMKKSTYADYAKYSGLGGIVLATGILAAISMGFAITRLFNIYTAIPIGLMWGAIIFNLDRFIVSSTGKGDGKHDISFGEFLHALPRICMAALIGITISAPLEVYIFQKEINKQWEEEIRVGRNKVKDEKLLFFKDDSILIAKSIQEHEQWISNSQSVVNNLKELEFKEQNNKKNPGRGNATKAWEQKRIDEEKILFGFIEEKKNLELKLENMVKAVNLEIQEWEYIQRGWTYDEIQDVMAGKLDKNAVNNKLGILDSITTLHKYPESKYPTLLIRLLFIFIEVAPVFFKLMIAFSPYDFLQENLKACIMAANGIQAKEGYSKLETGEIHDQIVYHEADQLFSQTRSKLEADTAIYKDITKAYTESEQTNIKNKPEEYIKKS